MKYLTLIMLFMLIGCFSNSIDETLAASSDDPGCEVSYVEDNSAQASLENKWVFVGFRSAIGQLENPPCNSETVLYLEPLPDPNQPSRNFYHFGFHTGVNGCGSLSEVLDDSTISTSDAICTLIGSNQADLEQHEKRFIAAVHRKNLIYHIRGNVLELTYHHAGDQLIFYTDHNWKEGI
ncbi:MAG: hypothetical protein ACOYXT_20690 [Bacteroidota bacterium]